MKDEKGKGEIEGNNMGEGTRLLILVLQGCKLLILHSDMNVVC